MNKKVYYPISIKQTRSPDVQECKSGLYKTLQEAFRFRLLALSLNHYINNLSFNKNDFLRCLAVQELLKLLIS